jgi:hypothetical protein
MARAGVTTGILEKELRRLIRQNHGNQMPASSTHAGRASFQMSTATPTAKSVRFIKIWRRNGDSDSTA